jgi:hypothetical protein
VNSRAFCASLGQTLPDAVFARDLDAALATLARTPKAGGAWRVKRAFGMAGRGQRVVPPHPEHDDGLLPFLRAALGEGGVQIEPDVRIVRELAIHGVVAIDGRVELGRLVEQRCDAHGQWIATTPALNAETDVAGAITVEGHRVAAALHDAGYFGPFGVDAFLYFDRGLCLQPRSEINARYSMGFSVGFVAKRRLPP